MEDKTSNTSYTDGSNSSSLEYADDQKPVSAFASIPPTSLVDNLEVRDPSGRPVAKQAESFEAAIIHSVSFSKRKAILVSTIITVLVTLLTGASVLFLAQKAPSGSGSFNAIPTQEVEIKNPEETAKLSEITGTADSLLVTGDVISRSSLKVTNSSFVAIIRPQALTGNQTYSLPNSSGSFCLDSNNCDFASNDDLQQLENQLAQISIPEVIGQTTLNGQTGAVSIQGASNQISVTTANGNITLATPQDIAPISSPTFSSLLLTGNLQVNGALSRLDLTVQPI
jgi:hypothetical protein